MENNDNLDLLKEQWKHIADHTSNLEDANRRIAANLSTNKVTSIQDRLARRVSCHGYMGLILPALSPLVYYVLHLPWWIALFYALFGIAMSIASVMLAEYIRADNLTELPVAQAIRRACKIKVRQQKIRLSGIIAGCVLLVAMAITLPGGPERESIVFGGAVGLSIGLAIGLRIYVINTRLTRRLIKSLNE